MADANPKADQETYVEYDVSVRGSRLRLRLHPDEAGGYWVNSPDMQGLISQGETTDDAVRNGIDAALSLIESREKDAEAPA